MSFCDISFNRKSGVVTDVLNKEGRESALYPQLVSYVQQDPQTVYDSKKEYFDALIDQGKLIEGKVKKDVGSLFESNPELANAVYEDLGFGINKLTNKLKSPSFNTQKEYYLAKGVSSLLSDIVTFTTDNDTKVLAEAILKIPNIDKIGLNVTKFDKETKDKGTIVGSPDALGTYNSFKNLIQIIGTLDKESFETVFLHEVVHSITVNEYYSNKEFADKINKLYNYTLKFKDYKTSTGTLLGEMYGMTNAKEFMSEAMTNPNFILELSKYYSPVQEKLKEKNIFQEFIDLIVNLVKEKISSKGKKYIEDNLGTVVLNTISNYANIKFINFKSVSKLENNQITPQQKQQAAPLSPNELALGLYSIAYNSGVSEQEFMNRINRDGNLSVFGVGDKQSTKRKKEKASPDSTEMFLKDTIENGLSKENQLLAKRLSSIPGFKNVTVEIANIPQYVMYNKAENKVQISRAAMENVDPIAFEKAILNTVMESIADNMLTTNRNALRSNQKFYGYISDMVKDLERRMPQEMKDIMNQPTLEGKVAAFISQYMSNPELREWSNKRIGDKKNFWNQLSGFIASDLFDKKILENAVYDYLSTLEDVELMVSPAVINSNVDNQSKKEQFSDYSSLANVYGELSSFTPSGVVVKSKANIKDLEKKVAAVNRFYGGEVLSLETTEEETVLKFSSSNLNKLIEKGRKFMEKRTEENNAREVEKEKGEEKRMVDMIPELSFLTEQQKRQAELLLKSNEFNLQCGL